VNLLSRLSPSHKFAVIVVVGVIALGTAVGTFASQDILPGSSHQDPSRTVLTAAQEPLETPTATETPEPTGTSEATETPEATGTPEATDTPGPEPTETPGATETPGPGASETPEATATPEVTGTPELTPTPGATETPEPTPTPGNGQRDVVGIPDDNPSHQPDDGDGLCEKGETVIKTTPGGNLVNVPCHSVEPGAPSFSHGYGQGGDDDESGDVD
jgi:hypothetical protein